MFDINKQYNENRLNRSCCCWCVVVVVVVAVVVVENTIIEFVVDPWYKEICVLTQGYISRTESVV